MGNIKRKWDILTKEKRAAVIKEIMAYFKKERNEVIGIVAAESLLDFFLQNLAEDIYNKAIDDAKTAVKKHFDTIEVDLDILLQK